MIHLCFSMRQTDKGNTHDQGKPSTNTDELTRDQKLAEIDRLVELGVPIAKACRDNGIPRPTYYRIKGKEAA